MTYARHAAGQRGIRSYAEIGLETEVLSATPERLITLLFAGARAALAQACVHIECHRVPERGNAIGKAIRIVDEGLRAGLDHQAGGELAHNLDRLYDYIIRILLAANLEADIDKLKQADALLENIATAWQTSVDRQPSAV